MKIDKDGARLYSRKRHDVWVTIYYGPKGGGDQASTKCQVLMFEGDGDDEGTTDGMKDDEDEPGPDLATATTSENDDDGEPGPNLTTPTRTDDAPGATGEDDGTSSVWSRVLHGTYTTLWGANKAALTAFMEHAAPRTAYIDHVGYFRNEACPAAKEAFRSGGWGRVGCTTPACFEMDVEPKDWGRWGFRKCVVEVIQSELKGPIELDDMVEEKENEEDEGNDGGDHVENEGDDVGGEDEATEGREEFYDGEISEEE